MVSRVSVETVSWRQLSAACSARSRTGDGVSMIHCVFGYAPCPRGHPAASWLARASWRPIVGYFEHFLGHLHERRYLPLWLQALLINVFVNHLFRGGGSSEMTAGSAACHAIQPRPHCTAKVTIVSRCLLDTHCAAGHGSQLCAVPNGGSGSITSPFPGTGSRVAAANRKLRSNAPAVCCASLIRRAANPRRCSCGCSNRSRSLHRRHRPHY